LAGINRNGYCQSSCHLDPVANDPGCVKTICLL
jgi:hypothetical protein